jgi:hypothetical protein
MISLICEKYGITNYTINPDGSIDVDGDVDLSFNDLTELPLRFNKVSGYFRCHNNRLTSLKGCPRWVGGYFNCNYNRLPSLEFSPEYVSDDFNCSYNKYLTNNYCDTEISGYFYTSLKQSGLILDKFNRATNYNEWRKIYKRKLILDEISKIYNEK